MPPPNNRLRKFAIYTGCLCARPCLACCLALATGGQRVVKGSGAVGLRMQHGRMVEQSVLSGPVGLIRPVPSSSPCPS